MEENFEEKYINKVICGDCFDVMSDMPDGCVDLVVTSPPYDDLRHYNHSLENWCSDKFKAIVRQLYRVIKEGGVVVWVVNDKTEKGSKTLTSFEQALYFREVGFNVNDVMIWEKSNPIPVVKQPRYSDVFEYMMVFSKGLPKTFNPIMVPCKCAGQDYDSTCKNMDGESGRTEKHFKINKEKVSGNIWRMAVAQNKTKHPAVFPYEIPYKHILSWSNEGDVVMDIFAGSGTTLKAARDLNRKYIGVEINKDYIEIIDERMKDK